jgi:hypothetical protein
VFCQTQACLAKLSLKRSPGSSGAAVNSVVYKACQEAQAVIANTKPAHLDAAKTWVAYTVFSTRFLGSKH